MTKCRIVRKHAAHQLRLLHISAELRPAAPGAVKHRARTAARHQQRGMQDDPHVLVDKLDMGPVIRPSPLAQYSEAGIDRMRKPKEVQCLINKVRPKIEPQPCAWTRIFAPALTHDRAKTIDVRLIVRYFAEHTCF